MKVVEIYQNLSIWLHLCTFLDDVILQQLLKTERKKEWLDQCFSTRGPPVLLFFFGWSLNYKKSNSVLTITVIANKFNLLVWSSIFYQWNFMLITNSLYKNQGYNKQNFIFLENSYILMKFDNFQAFLNFN